MERKLTVLEVVFAFKMAACCVGEMSFRLKGRNHDERVALKPWVSKAIRDILPYEVVCPGHKTAGPRRLYPKKVVDKALQILDVPRERIVSKIW